MPTNAKLHIETLDYAWSNCSECGNTIKFGPGAEPGTVCPACGCRFAASRSTGSVWLLHVPDEEEFWEINDECWDD